MHEDRLIQFLTRAGIEDGCAGLTGKLSRLLDEIGFTYFVVLRRAPPFSPLPDSILAGHAPETWLDEYSRKRYDLVDPVVRYARKSQQAFRWSDALAEFSGDPHFDRMRRVINEAASVGLEDGYLFPVHGDRGLIGYLSVGGKAVDLADVDRRLLDAVAKKVFWDLLTLCEPDIVEAMTAPVPVQLTRREMEALGHLAAGKTSNEIGVALNISSNTVDWYMSGIQTKLQARNRHHAVALAFRLGLIS